MTSGARGPQFHCFPAPFHPLQCHLNVRERKRHGLHPSSPRAHPRAGRSLEPQLESRLLGLPWRLPPGFRTVEFPQPLFLPHPSHCCVMNGKPRPCLSHFPARPAKAGGKEAGEPRDLFPTGAPKTQAKDTCFIFPSFNLKQKRHRGSKIKISFFPLPNLYPSSTLQPPASCPAGTRGGRVQASPAGEGEGGEWGG